MRQPVKDYVIPLKTAWRSGVRRGELPGRENENGNDVDRVVYSVGRCLRATHSLFWLRKLVGRAGVEPAAR